MEIPTGGPIQELRDRVDNLMSWSWKGEIRMDKLTEQQRKELIDHMNKHEDDSFAEHASWARRRYGVQVTQDECSKMFLNFQLGV